ncbi:MAG: agmatinase [Alphaproteobacteria bacterium]|nr:agmatinase [Alphaproteobacteria bacterium]
MTDTKDFPQPVSGTVTPRFGDVATFMRLPLFRNPGDVEIGMIGVPWDGGTTNRPGARHGPRQMRDLSTMMRRIHHVTGVAPYELAKCGDLGDASVNPASLDDSLERITKFYTKVHEAGAVPLSAGGDHLITLPIMRGISKGGHGIEGAPFGMVRFDAHSDTWDTYFGGYKYTHGTPFRRAVEEGLLDPKRVVQIGIRGSLYKRDDNDWALEQGMRVITIEEYFDLGVDKVISEARRVVGDGPTYVSFDVDGLDPAYAPGTGTPEIGGYTPHEAQRMLRGLRGLNLVGGDVVEVSPPFDMSGNTALVGVTMMWEILCLLAEAVAKRKGRI